jgi:drug/metabolite transporter (DMT)-like permease
LLARLTLSEPLPAHYIVGMAVVLAGVAITQLG